MRTLAFFLFIMTLISLFIFNTMTIDRAHTVPTQSPEQLAAIANAQATASANHLLATQVQAQRDVQLAEIKANADVAIETGHVAVRVEEEKTKRSTQWASVGTTLVNVVGGITAFLAFLYVFYESLTRVLAYKRNVSVIGLQRKQLEVQEAAIQKFGAQDWRDITDYARRNRYDIVPRYGEYYLVTEDDEVLLLPDR